MVDLEERLRTLDEITLPDLWPVIEARARQAELERAPLRMPSPRRRWMRLAPVAVAAIVALIATIVTVVPRPQSAFAVLEQARERFDRRPFHATIRNVFGEFVGDERQVVEYWFKSETKWRSAIVSTTQPSAPTQAGDFTVFDGKRLGRYEKASNTFFVRPASEIDDPYLETGWDIHDPAIGRWDTATGIKPTAQFLNENCRVSGDEVAGRAADRLTCDTGLEGNTIRKAEIWLDRETGLILKMATSEVVREFLSIEYDPTFPDGIFDAVAPEGARTRWAGEGPPPPELAVPLGTEVTATIPVGKGITSVEVGLGAVWVVASAGRSDEDSWLLARIDPRTNSVVATSDVGVGASVAAGEGLVWVTGGRMGREAGQTLRRLDPATNAFAGEPIQLGSRPTGVAVGLGAVWVGGITRDTPPESGELLRIEPQTGEITRIPLRGAPFGDPVFGAGSVWVLTQTFESRDPNARPVNRIHRVDPRTNEVVATISIASGGPLSFGEGALWMQGGDVRAPSLVKIDPATNRVSAEIDLAPGAGPFAAGAGFVWVANGEEQMLQRIDPGTSAVVGDPIRIGRGAEAVAIGQGAVWVGHYADGTVARVDV